LLKDKFIVLAIISIVSMLTSHCNFRSQVDIIDSMDPDIVIINIEHGDRAFIGDLLLKIDSCQPQIIAIDSWFIDEQNHAKDSVLEKALLSIENDILGYGFDFDNRKIVNSHQKFRNLVKYEGHTILHMIGQFSSNFIPQITIDNVVNTNIALRILEMWQPGYKSPYKIDELVPIHFTLTLDQIRHINGSEFIPKKHASTVSGKIVLLGYIGPSDEDKHFTPIRNVLPYEEGKPDTYGVVILANQIRTLLE